MKKLLPLFLLSLFAISTSNVKAQEKFSTFYNVTYQVNTDQTTKVIMDIDLRNNTTGFYAGSYKIQTGFEDISNIKASDLGGELNVKSTKNDKGTELSFDFIDKVVGINKTQEFTVSFDSLEIAKNYGNIWEVNIPGISNQEEYTSFNTSVTVPSTFGSPSIIKPSVASATASGNTIKFTKKDLGKSGISVAYGEAQIYSFDLTYHLRNRNLYPVVTEIAIPSNNNYQEINIESINPKPIDVVMDSDGNWLAKFRLLPSEDFDVKVLGKAKVSYKPKKEVLTDTEKNIYLKPQNYWEVNDPEIRKLAKELKTPEAIYKYVVTNLKYDTDRVKETQERAGAKGVLANKASAVCLEFTDLFVALSRAAGIPARAVEGYANTNNSAKRPLSLLKDVLHSWPEYYDENKKAWIMVDPTWENTTEGIDYFNVFDFDHLTFAIKGADSEYPVPAGGYKIPGQKSTQDVKVTTSSDFKDELPTLRASTNFEDAYLGGLSIKGEIIVTNNSGVLAPNQTVKVESDSLNPKIQNLYFDKIPPYGKKTIPVKFDAKHFLTKETDTIKISIGKEVIEKNIVISPFYQHIYFIIGVLGVILIGLFTFALSIIIHRRRRLPLS
ncbi:MAG: hypothetical protein KBD51_03235 [Candidatus Levybacteria bacterium]|nr:hypothetical protein [Candidatus Levybacteria bacterium]